MSAALLIGWLSLALLEVFAISWLGPLLLSLNEGITYKPDQGMFLLDLFLSTEMSLPLSICLIMLLAYTTKGFAFIILLASQNRFTATIAQKRLGAMLDFLRVPKNLELVAPNDGLLVKTVMGDLLAFFFGGVWGGMTFICEILFVAVLAVYALSLAPNMTLIPVLVFSAAIGIYFYYSRAWLIRGSERLQRSTEKIADSLLTLWRGHKELWFYRDKLDVPLEVKKDFVEFFDSNRRSIFVNEMPRHLIEWLAVASLLLMVFLSELNETDHTHLLGVVATVAVLMFRTLPSVGRIAALLSNLRSNAKLYFDFRKVLLLMRQGSVTPRSTRNLPKIVIRGNLQSVVDTGIGQIVITGRSGSGKTSVLESLAQVNSLNMPESIKNIGIFIERNGCRYVPAVPVLFRRSLLFNIALKTERTAEGEAEEIASLIARLNLKSIISSHGSSVGDQLGPISTGEAKRVALARALGCHPNVLLVDEPTAGLDPASADRVRAILGEFAHKSLLVVASHDPKLIDSSEVRIEVQDH